MGRKSLTPDEALGKFKELVGKEIAEQVSDTTLQRILTARQYNIPGAKEQLLSLLEWRKEKMIDDWILPPEGPLLMSIRGYSCVNDGNPDALKYPQKYESYFSNFGGGCFHKLAKDGTPIYVERIGLHDIHSLAKDEVKDVFLDAHLYNNETLSRVLMPECSKRIGHPVETVTIIADLQGLRLSHFNLSAISIIKSIQDLDQLYYPERLERLFIVNAPRIFSVFWNVIRKWLDDHMRSKIYIFGSNKYTETLLEYIDEENLPSIYGGKCTCSHFQGNCVPCYRAERDPFADFEHQTTVGARAIFSHKVAVSSSNTLVECSFRTMKYGINCGVKSIAILSRCPSISNSQKSLQVEIEEEVNDLVRPIEHFDSHQDTCDFTFTAEREGTYLILFDNRHSLLTSKKLFYNVKIHESSSMVRSNSSLNEQHQDHGET